MTIAGLPCHPIPGWLTQFGSGCFIREDYSVNGIPEVQPCNQVFLSSSTVGKQCTNSWQGRQFMILVDLVFQQQVILQSEVWKRLEAVQRSLWGSDNWAADYVTNIQLKINQSLHNGEQLMPSEKKIVATVATRGHLKILPLCYFFLLHLHNVKIPHLFCMFTRTQCDFSLKL